MNTQYAPDHYSARLEMATKLTQIKRRKGWHFGLICVDERGVNISSDGVHSAHGRDITKFNTIILENFFSPIFASTAFVSDARHQDDNYRYLNSKVARFAIHEETGMIAGVWTSSGRKVIERASDKYYWETRTDSKIADLAVEKSYCVLPDGATMLILPEL